MINQDAAGRLRLAREAAGYETGADAADAMSVKRPTYAHHENGTNGFARVAARYARFYRVNLEWLLDGRGPMRPTVSPAGIVVSGRVGAGAVVYRIEDDTSADGEDQIELPDGANLTALKVVGDSQYPRYISGEYILVDREAMSPQDLLNCYALIDCADGRRLIKRIRKGTVADRYRLESHNAEPEEDVEVIAAFRVVGTLEP